jgi:hypothetical protein
LSAEQARLVPPINVQFSNGVPFFDGSRGDWLVPVLIVGTVVWLATLVRVLERPDFDPITRLTWVVVVVFVPFFGMVLYWCIGPAPAQPEKRRTALDPVGSLAGTPWEKNPGYTLPKK